MRFRPRTWFWLSLLLLAAAYWSWTYGDKLSDAHRAQAARAAALQAPGLDSAKIVEARNSPKNKSYRVSNTRQTEKQLLRSSHAIILRNALIDTQLPLKLDIPAHLRAKGAPGSYLVQSDGPMDRQVYDRLQQVGVTIVSYIPNNAALVQATPDQAAAMAGDAMFQAVLPYEPYYKLALNLLPAAVEEQPPQSGALNVTTFPGQRDAALAALQALGAQLMAEDTGPFGPTLTVMVPPENLTAVAQLPLAWEIEPYAPRRMLNDLTRADMGIATNTLYVTPNYLNLTGSNVTVNMNDSGVDKTHPDFKGPDGTLRLQGAANALFDYEGHGTHVAGIIMGNGSQSTNVTNFVPGSIIPGAGFQGKATNANLFVQSLGLVIGTTIAAAFQGGGTFVSDASLQTNASVELGATNLISNNSWGYDGVTAYDMHAASFDQATRDAQPGVRGEQPLLFVFAAGDGANGNDNGGGGAESSINSPATAKNVITVGAMDSLRNITNGVTFDDQSTNQIFLPWTDNSNLVAWFSGCGNVSPGTEGLSGRFKPDVVAPGVFTISCRSSNYVDPSYATEVTPYPFVGQVVQPGKINNYVLPLVPSNFPADTEELIIEATPNSQSPIPFPYLLILGAPSGQPLKVLGTNIVQPQANGLTNFVVVTENLDGQAWNFGVSTTNRQIQPVGYDLTFYLVETNDLGVSITNANGYYHVISNLNSVLKPFYVYQYGTSMSAGAVSGMLALMQEFLQTKMGVTNPAPALLKAMLINGSRSINQQYDFNTQLASLQPPSGPNEQGWGLPNLPNTLPSSLTNTGGNDTSMLLVNQSTNDALATGQWQSYQINCLDGNATNFPLRFNLVWTDPPGNPAAGIALVNNLDLLVTSGASTNSQIWLGNDFLSGDIFTTNNSGDAPDFVNNVQNVYIDNTNSPFQFPLTVTVLGSRVNVNAVTTQTNKIAQDYALVISSDDPALADSLTMTSRGISSGPLVILRPYSTMTNALGLPLLTWPLTAFAQGNSNLVTIASNAVPLLNQRVGANEPNLYANGGLYTTKETNGNFAQWHFFVFTNNQISPTNDATNVAFATFLPPNLATQIAPRTNGADIDLYVSTNPGLTNLDPAVFAAMQPSDMSLSRSGTETVIYSNSQPNEVYYIGVKSEDQQGADFDFYAIAQQTNFGNLNPDGSITYTYEGPAVPIPDDEFGVPPAMVIAIASKASQGRSVRKVTVTLVIEHANAGDLYGVLQPDQTTQVVLNNFSGPQAPLIIFTNTFNDLDDGFGGVNSDGPGSLQNFMSQTIPPLWMLQEMDSGAFQGGAILSFSVTVSPQPLLGPIVITLAPGQAYFDYVDVPNDAIFLTNAVTLENGTSSADLGVYMTNFNDVTQTDVDGTNITFNAGGGLQTPGGYLLVGAKSPLPLSGGIWYYGIFNDGSTTVTFTNEIFFDYNFVPNLEQTYTNTVPLALTTDGTTNSAQICVTSGQQVLDLSVGVRLDDPDLNDLVIQLTSPQGTSLVLFENRGGDLATNLGITLSNSAATSYVYTTFTEDTNLTDMPIKFAPPPYATNIINPQITIASNSFQYFTNEQGVFIYGAGTYTNGEIVDGWFLETNRLVVSTVITNQSTNQVTIQVTNQVLNEVTVMTDPQFDYDGTNYLGSNYLALASGRLSQTFTTVPGVAYEFRYYARSPGLTDWWPADDNTFDIVGTNNGTIPYHDVTFDVGEVERAFTFSGVSTNIDQYKGNEVDFGTNAGNFGTNDFSVEFWIKQPTNVVDEQACLEKRPECQANINFWEIQIGGGNVGWTNAPPGHLKSYIPGDNDTTVGEIVSSNAINDGVFHHVVLVRHGATYSYFIDGALDSSTVASGIANLTNSAMFRAGQSVCVAPGVDGSDNTQPFEGDLDELDLWQRALTPAEIAAIYRAGSSGKYSTNSLYPNFRITFDGIATNTVILTNFAETNWQAYTNSFIATSNQTTIELAGNPLGVLLDDIVLVQLPYTNYNNYYLPEEPLTPIIGQNPQGCWTLSIWDTRQDSAQPTNGTLLGWTLQLTTSSTNVNLIVLTNRVPYNEAPTTGITYFGVDVPATANYATNILFNASGPMNLFFNQNSLPTGELPGDVALVSLPNGGPNAGSNTLATQGAPPPLIPGQRYFLGVQNTGTGPESFSLQVNFDVGANTNIIALTNGISMTTNISTNGPMFYSFLVPTNAILATFQLLSPTNGEANLYAREGLPVPEPLSFDYESLNEGTNDQFIVVTTNSLPVPLQTVNTNDVLPRSPKTWYLSVYNPGTNTVGYTIVATYVTTNDLLIRDLNKFPNFTYRDLKPAVPPGFPTNVMYSFTVTNTNAVAVQFTVTNISTNGDLQLLVRDGAFPTPEDFYIGSFNPGTDDQFVSIVTNSALISLSNIWYAAVPNVSTNNATVRYSITAAILTNAPVTPSPLFIGASISSPNSGFSMYWSTVAGTSYQIQVSTNLSSWSVVTNITAQSTTAGYTDAVPVISQKSRYFRIVTQ
jgi:subtilisin-like proprotein convertase family protein